MWPIDKQNILIGSQIDQSEGCILKIVKFLSLNYGCITIKRNINDRNNYIIVQLRCC